MKRKSLRKSENAADEKNGNAENSDEPLEKKGRNSRGRNKDKQPSYEETSENERGSQTSEASDSPSQNGNQKKKGKKPKGKKSKEVDQENQEEEPETGSQSSESQDTDSPSQNGTQKKKGKKGKKSKEDEKEKPQVSEVETDPLGDDQDDDADDAEYEVDEIVGEKTIKGVKHFLIRWKGYTEESDTWEPEDTLDCSDLIKAFQEKNKKSSKKDTPKGKIKKEKRSEQKDSVEDSWDENDDFEVERIIDVYFHKDGSKDFLVSWKGYPASDNSWEPEANMDCKDLIAKYMAKCDEAKKFEGKESKLRVNRKPVERLAFSMHEKERRLSKRHTGRERVHYFDAE
ncbi:chromodomain-helicase-DNA-binding protein 2-like [Anthonomus grandis grandis]|uniref:chromodomain-helicase-DNA-binding protein 2-like n=1 Tax=Anthonomus grandis grandis TaxID=2921223 RepID=UPI0021663C36|nr:chromodomain-helicase-DNA-binding protein 2-like [Anthonomus grandis grandis]